MSEENIGLCEAIEAEIEQLDEFGPYTFGRVFGLVCRCEEAGFTDHLLRETLETLLDRFPARELSLLLNPPCPPQRQRDLGDLAEGHGRLGTELLRRW